MFGWSRRRERLLEEFEEHIELETAENIAAGMSLEAARRAARKRFGNTLTRRERARGVGMGVAGAHGAGSSLCYAAIATEPGVLCDGCCGAGAGAVCKYGHLGVNAQS